MNSPHEHLYDRQIREDIMSEHRCTTHFHACDCREAEFKKLREENERLKTQTGIDIVEEQLRIAKRKLQIAIEVLKLCADESYPENFERECKHRRKVARGALRKINE